MHIEIVSVCVGQPKYLGERNGKPVYSGIFKEPVESDSLLLTYTNLAGDQQVDTRPKPDGRQLHGGNEMAVYAYPSEHFWHWSEQLGVEVGPGTLGENLTVRGVLETDVCIGDKWRWGDALLEISKPRGPCYKLSMKMGTNMERLMKASGRCGWYLRVLEPGLVPTSGSIYVTEKGEITVAAHFAEKYKAARSEE